MSETPPRPDGSDPRVLTPDDDEPDVMIARQNTQAYHTEECRTIHRMRDRGITFKTVKQSVAEWRNLHECDNCRHEGAYDPDATPDRSGTTEDHSVTEQECDAWRTYLGNGMDALEIVDTVAYSETEVRRHLKGECDHDPDAPSYSYGWHHATDPPETREATGHKRLNAKACYAIRDRLLDGERVRDAADAMDCGVLTARNHARGRCPHHNSTPPLARGWYADE